MWDKEDPKKDAKKAMWYLNRLIQKLEEWKYAEKEIMSIPIV
jgi:hypothetical protein